MRQKSLLEKIREINRLFLKTESNSLDIPGSVAILGTVVEAAVFAVDLDGKLLGSQLSRENSCAILQEYVAVKGAVPEYYFTAFLRRSTEPQINVLYQPGVCALVEDGRAACGFDNIYLTLIPILGGGEKVSMLLLHRCSRPFDHDDVILAEIGAAFCGFIFMRRAEELVQESARNKNLAEIAFESLSYSEVEAINRIIGCLENEDNIVVASKIADELGITRSVIVNALRKCESAGIIESRSLGMKGTHVRVRNPQALKEIAGRSSRVKYNHGRGGRAARRRRNN